MRANGHGRADAGDGDGADALDLHLRRLRALLERRIGLLRRQWSGVPLAEYRPLVVSDQEVATLLDAAAPAPPGGAAGPEAPSDEDLDRLGQRIARIERALALASKGGAGSRLDQAARAFGLGRFERDVLLLAFAPWLDAGFGRLYAYCHDDAARRDATARLALELAPPPGGVGEALAALAAHAPLRRLRLVRLGEAAGAAPLLDRPLALDEGMAAFLAGAEAGGDAPDTAGRVVPLPPAPLSPELEALVPGLAALLAAAPGRPVSLVGPPGSGRRALACAVAARLGRPIAQAEPGALADAGTREEAIAGLARGQRLHGHVLYVDADGADGAASAEDRKACRLLLDALPGPVLLATRSRWAGLPEGPHQAMPRSSPAGRQALWAQALDGLGAPWADAAEEVAHEFDLGPHQVLEAARTAVQAAASAPRGRRAAAGAGPGRAELWRACRGLATGRMGELAQRIEPASRWEDIVLPRDVVRQLREVADQVAHRARVHEAWGFAARRSRGLGISALFAGPSGTGKTMAAEVLARHLDLDLYRIDLASVVNKYVGETEKNLRQVFDAADAGGAILFFDEADALFGKRTDVKDAHDRYANIEIDYLLQRMEEFRGLAILATNRRTDLDRAFLRRLRAVIEFPFPDHELRRGIWQRSFPADARCERLDFDALARLEIAGGSIRNVALAAAFLAAGEGKAIAMRHVLHAARREYAKIERQAHDAEFAPLAKAVGK